MPYGKLKVMKLGIRLAHILEIVVRLRFCTILMITYCLLSLTA
jgi:hypothetical protein